MQCVLAGDASLRLSPGFAPLLTLLLAGSSVCCLMLPWSNSAPRARGQLRQALCQPAQGTVGRQYASPQSALTCRYSLGESSSSLLTRLSLVLSPRAASPQASRGIVVSLFCFLNLRTSATVGPTTSRTRRLLQHATAPSIADGWVFIMCSP
jgi:hypothetical protein